MPTQYRFPLHPAGAKEVNEVLAIHEAKGQVAYFAAGVPVFTHAADDPVGRRFAAVQLVELGLAEQTELAPALGLHRATIHRCRRKVQAAGVLGLVEARPGPKGRHKLTGPRLQEAQAQLDAGASLRAAAAAVGVREGTLRHALGRGDPLRPVAAPPAPPPPPGPAGPPASPAAGPPRAPAPLRSSARPSGRWPPPAASPRRPRASPPPRPSRGPGSSAPCRPCSSTGSSRWASTSTAACATASTACAASSSPWPFWPCSACAPPSSCRATPRATWAASWGWTGFPR